MYLASGDTGAFLDYASKGGVAALLVIILYGGFKEKPWWVFGWVYRDLLVRYNRRGLQLDRWWDQAAKATATVELLAKNRVEDGDHSDEVA